MKFNKREKQIFYLCLFLFLLLIVQKVVLSPLSGKLDALSEEIQLLETRLIKGVRQEAQREQILKAYKNYADYLKLSGSDEEVTAEFLKEIERLARESDVSLLDVKPRAANKSTSYKEYTIDIRAEASMKNVVSFLYSLNNSTLLLKTDKLTLSPREENSEILRANMLISGIVVL